MNPQLKQMPLWRDANRLLLLIEDAVRGFPRYHEAELSIALAYARMKLMPFGYKYTLGSDLRRQAMNIVRLIARAVHDRESRSQHLKRLIFSVDDMKVLIQLGKELKVFQDFKVFQTLAELVVGGSGVCGQKQVFDNACVCRIHCAPIPPERGRVFKRGTVSLFTK